MSVSPSAGIRYVARVSTAEAKQLKKLRHTRPVHKSLPADHPRRRDSRELSELMARLHLRGVPIDVLAEVVGISHQAVRSRIREADNPGGEVLWASTTTVSDAPEGAVLVVDSGLHRRVLLHPTPATVPHLYMLTDVPHLSDAETARTWLESSSGKVPGTAASSTPLRTPPAAYLDAALVDELLVPLTTTNP